MRKREEIEDGDVTSHCTATQEEAPRVRHSETTVEHKAREEGEQYVRVRDLGFWAASACAIERPRPREAPVTIMLLEEALAQDVTGQRGEEEKGTGGGGREVDRHQQQEKREDSAKSSDIANAMNGDRCSMCGGCVERHLVTIVVSEAVGGPCS